MTVTLPPDYKPSDKEEFMSEIMIEHFRQKLLAWKADLLTASNDTLQQLQEGGTVEADIADRASIETDRSLELRTRDRARKLINKIDDALSRIENGSYGYCEETAEPISSSSGTGIRKCLGRCRSIESGSKLSSSKTFSRAADSPVKTKSTKHPIPKRWNA